ncbi:hypothetical protein [Streptomyces sp. URMC 129]|uniref:hypothetical protein n=1 Tax=Streptomyces sp. URMC 129 TaxID=3423407 RepID=UPI003F195596
MGERVQWVCELAGMGAAGMGAVVIGAAVAGALGAGLALVVVGAGLVVVGNMSGKGSG